ncbi:MAG: alpha/beta fold hydrolase [Woeseiaceae bacterium]|nr:alpha/beta fold hydrolase [Woeseiaceae bacterium]
MTIVVLAAALAGTAWLLTPPRLAGNVSVPDIPGDIDSWLADTESAAAREFKLIPGTEKRIRWQQPGVRTRYSVVYLHGFSATRQEIAPTNERVADGLGANLFETRLRGHGHGERPMHEVRAEDWLADGIEALQIAAILGDEVIVIGTSTGATLALALADHPLMQNVAAMVFISPNMAPADPNAVWMTRPAGPLLAQLIAGDTRSWVAHNDAQERYWSTSYPTAATVEVMRLVDRANRLASMPLNAAVLMLLSPDDTVISPAAARRTFGEINAPLKRLDEVDGGGDPSNHVLAGDILSPDATDVIASRIIDFVIDAHSRPAS